MKGPTSAASCLYPCLHSVLSQFKLLNQYKTSLKKWGKTTKNVNNLMQDWVMEVVELHS